MNAHIDRLLTRFAEMTVVVVGDAMLDVYLNGTASRLCREAPAPVVNVTECKRAPGGAANAARNIRALGARAVFVSTLGADQEGNHLAQSLLEADVRIDYLVSSATRATLTKQRLVADNQTLTRFDTGSTGHLDQDTEAELIASLELALPHADAVLVSDYAYGTMTEGVLRALQRLRPAVLVVDARSLTRYRALAPSAVKPNYAEALDLLGIGELGRRSGRNAVLERSGAQLVEATGARLCAVTLDVDGALAFERNRPPYRSYARKHPTRAWACA